MKSMQYLDYAMQAQFVALKKQTCKTDVLALSRPANNRLERIDGLSSAVVGDFENCPNHGTHPSGGYKLTNHAKLGTVSSFRGGSEKLLVHGYMVSLASCYHSR
jgi:hypothetical protein